MTSRKQRVTPFFSLSNSSEMAKIGMIFAAVQRGGDHYDTHFVHMCVVVTKSVVVICHVSHTLVGYRTGSCHPGPGPLSVAGLHQREARTTTIRTLPRGSSCLSWQRVCIRQNWVPEFLLALSIPRQSSRVGWQFERFFGRAENIRHSVQVGLNVVELVLLTYLPCLAGGFFFATLNLCSAGAKTALSNPPPSLVWAGRDVFCGGASEKQHFSTAVETVGCVKYKGFHPSGSDGGCFVAGEEKNAATSLRHRPEQKPCRLFVCLPCLTARPSWTLLCTRFDWQVFFRAIPRRWLQQQQQSFTFIDLDERKLAFRSSQFGKHFSAWMFRKTTLAQRCYPWNCAFKVENFEY